MPGMSTPIVRLNRTGNSLTLVVPRSVLQALGWKRGETLAVGAEAGRLVAKAIDLQEALSTPLRASARRALARQRR